MIRLRFTYVHQVFWQDTDQYASRISRFNDQEAMLPSVHRCARAAMAVCA